VSDAKKPDLLPLCFRLHEAADAAFCAKAFILNTRQSPGINSQLGQVAWPRLQFLFEELWEHPKVAWIIACDPEHPSFIHGFLVGERVATVGGGDVLVIHFAYVRQVSRRFGVARRLVARFDTRPQADPSQLHYSTVTPTAREILRKRIGWGIYDPWYLWEHVSTARKRAVDKATARLRADMTRVTDGIKETPATQALGYIDPNPALSTPPNEETFQDEFDKMTRAARFRGGAV
jgi:hypothetical protein